MDAREDYSIFHLGDFDLDSGEVLPNAFIAYKTYGEPSNPALVYLTWYTGSIADNAPLISPNSASLNPEKYFIIIPALFGNGQSISPSNTPALQGGKFPTVTFADNVRAQHRLLTSSLGIRHVKAVLGWSMGAGQAFQWAVQYPEFMDAAIPWCGSAKTAIHNNAFLEGQKSALIAARGGWTNGVGKGQSFPTNGPWSEDEKRTGLKAFGHGYAGWGFSQAFYRERLFEKHFGAPDLDTFMKVFWEAWVLSKDPENLLVMLQTWQLGDISASPEFGGDINKALKSIKAKCLVVPSKTDLYFPPEDSQFEVDNMSPGVGRCLVIPSIWGHWAGGTGDSKADWEFLDRAIAEHLAQV